MTKCIFCAGTLELLPKYTALRRITSDCRPWPRGGHLATCTACHALQKPIDREFKIELDRIYGSYEIYYQSSGNEQLVFSGATSESRSMALLKRAMPALSPAASGRLLDVGCGNGALLQSFSALMPKWRLAGIEVSDTHRRAVESIPGVEALYVGDIESVSGCFDVITMIHALEHFDDPVDLLKRLKTRLAPGGKVLIQVPDNQQNPFDILTADHITHFSRNVLHQALNAAGYNVLRASNDWIVKELSMVATPGLSNPVEYDDEPDGIVALLAIDMLNELVSDASRVATSPPFGLFGTSIGATWLATELREADIAIDFFVDEDRDRIGRQHLGRPVIAPKDVPTNAKVYLPLAPTVAHQIADRLGADTFLVPASFAR